MNLSESAATALAHLEMICQAASGDYSLKKGELEKRRLALIAFIHSGQGVASEDDRAIALAIRQAVNSGQGELSLQAGESLAVSA